MLDTWPQGKPLGTRVRLPVDLDLVIVMDVVNVIVVVSTVVAEVW